MESFLCEQNQLNGDSEGLKHGYSVHGQGSERLAFPGHCRCVVVFAGVRRRKLFHLIFRQHRISSALQDRTRTARWFGSAQSEAVDLLSEDGNWW